MNRGRGWGESTYTYLLQRKPRSKSSGLCLDPDRGGRRQAIGLRYPPMDQEEASLCEGVGAVENLKLAHRAGKVVVAAPKVGDAVPSIGA